MEKTVEKRRYTIEEYVRLEEQSGEKHEYFDGEVVAMAGGSPDHSLVVLNTGGELRNRLKGKPCRTYDSNLRIRIPRKTLYVYPDVVVVCGQRQIDPQDPTLQAVTNPRVVVEVLSPSTEGCDRGEKFSRYREIESFEEYVLISQGSPCIETYYRQPDETWLFAATRGPEGVAKIHCLGVELLLAEVYAGVNFPDAGA